MFTMAMGLKEHVKQNGWAPSKAMRPAALLGMPVLTSITVNALIVLADSNLRQRAPATGDCSAITDKADRLACFDDHARRPVAHPFRGANAPALSHAL